MKVKKEELAEILCVKIVTIRSLESRNQLKEKLREKGYLLLGKQKDGRSFIYDVKLLSPNKESLNNCISGIFNSSNEEKISEYILYRNMNLSKPLTKKYISKLCDVSEKTIRNWDDIMVKNNLLAKDGFFYIAMDFHKDEKATYRITDKNEYSSFIKNNFIIKERDKKMEQWKNNEIDNITFQIYMDGSTDSLRANYNKIVYKVSKFNIGKNTELFKLILDLIKKVYKFDENDYYQGWLPSEKDEKRAFEYMGDLN